MKQFPITYAVSGGETVHISEVLSGLDCDCVCSLCKSPLEAHKGKTIVHHFKHYNKSECANGYETSIHLAAKRLLDRNRKLTLPMLRTYVSELGYEITLASSNTYALTNVAVEQSVGGFRPDIIAEIEVIHQGKTVHRKIIVEIAVTHFCDDIKIKKIISSGISAIEIDLSRINENLDDDLLWHNLNKQENIKWIFNAKEVALKSKAVEVELKNQNKTRSYYYGSTKHNAEEISKRYRDAGFSLLKIYHARKIYTGGEVHNYEFTGDVYCPKLSSKIIKRRECEECSYHHSVLNNFSADEYKVVCGFRREIKAVQNE